MEKRPSQVSLLGFTREEKRTSEVYIITTVCTKMFGSNFKQI